MTATTRETWVAAQRNVRLAEYEHRLNVISAELVAGQLTAGGAVFLFTAATRLVSGQLARLEAFEAAGRRAS